MSTRPPARRAAIWGLLAAAVSILVVACGGSVSPSIPPSASSGPVGPSLLPASPSPSASASPKAANLILKVTTEGGFINPVATLSALPLVEVYADGRILAPGPVPAIAPAPLLPVEDVRNVGAGGADEIVAAIKAAGLDQQQGSTAGVPGDSGTNVFTVTLGGTTVENRVSGNGPGVGRPGGIGGSASPGQAAALDLLTRLLDPSETWGAGSAPVARFEPTGYRVFAAPVAPGGDPSTPQRPVAWPLGTPLASFGVQATPDRGVPGLRQGAVVGDDARTLGPVLQSATLETGFASGGKTWTLYVRPLLPDELGG